MIHITFSLIRPNEEKSFGLAIFKFLFLISTLLWIAPTQATTHCAGQTQIPATECEALLTFYQKTNGPSWTTHTGWNETNKPCSWFGVSCSGGHVSSLSLRRNNLKGTLPNQLSDLTHMVMLHLSSNQLRADLPPKWKTLAELQSMDLFDNQLTGNLPLAWETLTKLQELYLGANQLSGNLPSSWGEGLTQLQKLYLGSNQLSGTLPTPWGKLSALQKLDLSSNQLNGSLPSAWGKLSMLQELDLSSNQLSGDLPSAWGKLTKLQKLYLGSNQFSGNLPPDWETLTQLEWLFLSSNRLSGTLPPAWEKLAKLQHLYLSSNQFAGDIPQVWTHLVNLKAGWSSLEYNMLTVKNSTVEAFLNQKMPAWETTQTVPPLNFKATDLSSNSIRLNWTPILYQKKGGYYEIGYATTSGGPYTFQPVVGDKTVSTHPFSDLSSGTTYYFVVRTKTPAYSLNPNALIGLLSAEISATTPRMNVLTVTVNGQGQIQSKPAEILCSKNCSKTYLAGTSITLTALPEVGYTFKEWGKNCSGNATSTLVTLDAAKQCSATFIPLYTLAVNVTQGGTVSSDPVGIQCGKDCNKTYPAGTQVTLTALPKVGYTFKEWGKNCSGNATSTLVTLDAAKQCSATFTSSYFLEVSIIGHGIVTSDPTGIQCGEDCSENYPAETPVSLRAIPARGYTFGGWGENCGGTDTSTRIMMTTNQHCTATFITPYTLHVDVTGNGQVVSSKPVGIDCGDKCDESYANRVVVTLKAIPVADTLFTSWSGDCAGTSPTTKITVDAQKTCVAEFLTLKCKPTVYSSTTQKLHTSAIAVSLYSPLDEQFNGQYVICKRQDNKPLAWRYLPEQEGFVLQSKQEIICADQQVELQEQACFPIYSAKERTLEFPNVKVTPEAVEFPSDKELEPALCYRATLTQGAKVSDSGTPLNSLFDSQLLTLTDLEEITCW